MTTTKIQVTEDKVIELLLQITSPTDEYGPDHRGDGQVRGLGSTCNYVYNDNTRCIVGEVMHRLGVSDDRLLEYNETTSNGLLEELREDGVIDYSEPAAYLLSRVQHRQDTGYPWGDAVRLELKGAG